MTKTTPRVTRISMSLPEELLTDLDGMLEARNSASRSQVISDMIHQHMVEHKSRDDGALTAGTITLLYNNAVTGLQKRLANIQVEYIDEVISSLHVHLEHNQTMEVILVQGPAGRLQLIADLLMSQRGVISGKIHLMAAVIPQVHPFTGQKPQRSPA
ncbi:MAG TPA: nickel-responsive transcriptional regulator NikR [Rhizomicrobium sp.]